MSLTCRIKANPSVNPASIQWQYDALMAVSVPNNVSKQFQEQDLLRLKFNTSRITSSNNTKADIRQRNSVKAVISNDSWNYNDNTIDSFMNTKSAPVWKLVEDVLTGKGTPGYTIETTVSL